jgi:hypothetical protein
VTSGVPATPRANRAHARTDDELRVATWAAFATTTAADAAGWP